METIKSERISQKPGIADHVIARRERKDCFLDEINRLIDWKSFEKLLRQKLTRVVNAVGNPAYPPLPMFKILLLHRWYNLGGAAMEAAGWSSPVPIPPACWWNSFRSGPQLFQQAVRLIATRDGAG
jgi:hypothetical protein